MREAAWNERHDVYQRRRWSEVGEPAADPRSGGADSSFMEGLCQDTVFSAKSVFRAMRPAPQAELRSRRRRNWASNAVVPPEPWKAVIAVTEVKDVAELLALTVVRQVSRVRLSLDRS
jgi:hypothetical protein